MQMLQIFNEFAWLVHVGILDGVKKNQIQGVCWRTINNLTLRVYLFLRQFFLKLNKKRRALICFIELTSILAHAKTQLDQAVKPIYSLNVVKRRRFQFFTMRF